MAEPFSQDILAEILKRLPLKSLLRLRCVQKSWYHLIQSPNFIHLHYDCHNKENNNNLLLFQDRYRTCFSIRVDDEQCKEYCPQPRFPIHRDTPERSDVWVHKKIHGTSRGLICVSIKISNIDEQVYLWNPVIGKYRSLSNSPIPSNDPHENGLAFGYFGKINDYKVIKLEIYRAQSKEARSDYAYVYIYSLSTNSWKTVPKYDLARFGSYLLYNSVVVNGAAYWILRKWYLENTFKCFQVIVCFDTVKETIREIMLPPQHSYNYVNLVEEFGEASLLCVDINRCICDLWVPEKEGTVWTKMITVDFNQVFFWVNGFNDDGNWLPIGFNNYSKLVLISYDFETPWFCSYDPEMKEATDMVHDSSKLWSYAAFEDPDNPPDNPRIDYGHVAPYFDHRPQELQPMYVNSFEENLVLLGEEGEVKFKDD